MKLMYIAGSIWELSILESDELVSHCSFAQEQKNEFSIKKENWGSMVKCLPNNIVRSKAYAAMELDKEGINVDVFLPIYHSDKGFYCDVEGEIVYLKDLIDDDVNMCPFPTPEELEVLLK